MARPFRPFGLFGLLLGAVCISNLLTVHLYPMPWGDEVNLMELGRVAAFDRQTDWSIILNPLSSSDAPTPAIFPTYVGGAVTECLYRTTGTFLAHRIFSLVGLACASLLCCLWLSARGYAPWVAALGAFLFASECHVTRIAHFYRPDLWILAMTFACALWIMRLATLSRRRCCVHFALLGIVLAFHLLYWFSAVFSWPILLAEVLILANKDAWGFQAYILNACAAGIGFVVGLSLLLLIPFHDQLGEMFGWLTHHPDLVNIQSSLQPAPGAWARVLAGIRLLCGNARTFLMLAARSPFLWSLAVVGLVWAWKRNRTFAAVFLIQLFVILATNIYAQRVVYLLPGAVLLAAAAMQRLAESAYVNTHAPVRRVVCCFYGASVVFGLALVMAINIIAGWGGTGRPAALFRNTLQQTIGAGPKRVYLFTWEPYFDARALGWKLFSFLPLNAKVILDERHEPLLRTMDYILAQDETNGLDSLEPLTGEEKAYLTRHGFAPCARIPAGTSHAPQIIRSCKPLLFSYDYPPFTVWKNQLR